MGRGGDAGTPANRPTLRRSRSILDALNVAPKERLRSLRDDVNVLRNIWLTVRAAALAVPWAWSRRSATVQPSRSCL